MKIKSIMDVGFTYKGNTLSKKDVSDDNFFFAFDNKTSPSIFLAVVCDGVGSLKGSNAASEFVTDKIKEFVESKNFKNLSYTDLLRSVENLVLEIHESSFWENNMPIATTMTLLVLTKDRYITLNIGDSRCYLVLKDEKNRAKLLKITEDDVDKDSGKVTQCIGNKVKKEIDVNIRDGKLPDKFRFLVTSDGLYKKIGENEILINVLDENDINKSLENLVKIARRRKEMDDITFIYIER